MVATNRATHFFDAAGLSCKCHLDEHEWVCPSNHQKLLKDLKPQYRQSDKQPSLTQKYDFTIQSAL